MNIRRELFNGESAESYLSKIRQQARAKIHEFSKEELSPEKLAGVRERIYANRALQPLKIAETDPVLEDSVEVDRPARPDYGVSRPYRTRMYVLNVPFSGSAQLFDLQPSSNKYSTNPAEKVVCSDHVAIRIYEDGRDEKELRKRFDREIEILQYNANQLTSVVNLHNEQLRTDIDAAITSRLAQLESADKLLHGIGFTVRKRGDPIQNRILPVERKPLPVTSAVPAPGQPIQTPQRTLLEARIFEDILSTLAGMGVAIERSPTAFSSMEEETLRTWFLVALNGVYQGTATAETFNMLGKADITIRHLGEILFIAECKFWSGPKGLTEAIDQLLGYLTWHEQRAALLLFNRNKDFSGVLAQVPLIVKNHPNFVRLDAQPSLRSAFRFTLRSRTDAKKEVQITLLAFDVPQVPKKETT